MINPASFTGPVQEGDSDCVNIMEQLWEAGVPTYAQRMPPEAFFPIGEVVVPELTGEKAHYWGQGVDVLYVPDDSGVVSREWFTAICPPEVSTFVSWIRAAFEEYFSEWCGADMAEEIQEELSSNAAWLARFQDDGHLPFLFLGTIAFSQRTETILLELGCELDYNLEEHGIEILVRQGKVRFGYGADFTLDVSKYLLHPPQAEP